MKYLEVAQYFFQQHPRLIVVACLIIFVLVALWYLAEREFKQVVTQLPEDKQ